MLRKNILCFLLFVVPCLFSQAQTFNDENYILSSYERNFDSLLNNFFYNKSLRLQTQNFEFNTDTEFISAFDVPDSIFIQRLKTIPSVVPMSYNDKVRNYIEFYVNRYKKSINVMLSLSEYYFPIFEEILDQTGVPLELKYLTIIESALNPQAVSRAGAAGLWQFMYSTGKLYDLRINSLVDERRDPIKSSIAAANYLRDLYNVYKDWTLAIAAYNCGPGNINKAIRRSGGKTNYWEIYEYLPKETRGYIPAYIAATYVMHYYKDHGIYPSSINFPTLTDTVMIHEDIHLGQISEVLSVPIEELRILNPQYKNDVIPGKSEAYSLKLPINIVPEYINMKDSIISYKSNLFFQPILSSGTHTGNGVEKLYYKVKKNDTWVKIADNYGVNVSDLKRWNNQKNRKIPIVGNQLVVYRHNPVLETKSLEEVADSTNISANQEELEILAEEDTKVEIKKVSTPVEKEYSQPAKYKVQKGDTLYGIARDNNTTVDNLMSLNNLSKKSVLKAGQVLKIR